MLGLDSILQYTTLLHTYRLNVRSHRWSNQSIDSPIGCAMHTECNEPDVKLVSRFRCKQFFAVLSHLRQVHTPHQRQQQQQHPDFHCTVEIVGLRTGHKQTTAQSQTETQPWRKA